MTPKQRRLVEREQPPQEAGPPSPILLDPDFDADELAGANIEWSHWKWPGRDDA